MQELLEAILSHFSEPLVDGRVIHARMKSEKGEPYIRVGATRYCEGQWLADIVRLDGDYVVDAPYRPPARCSTCDQVIAELDELAKPYSNHCWNCAAPVSLTTENRCPKCRRFVLCACGKCLCDNPDYHVRSLLSEEQVKELNRRFGSVFAKRTN